MEKFYSKKSFAFKKNVSIALTIVMLMFTLMPALSNQGIVHAAALTTAELRFDRLKTGVTDVNVLVMFKPNDVTSATKVRVAFATAIGVDATPANITTNVTGVPAGCTDPVITGDVASAVSGDTVTFDATAIDNTAETYCFNIEAGIDTPTGGNEGSHSSTVSVRTNAAELGATSVTNYFVSNDQVTVSASVPSTFTFALGANSTSFTTDLSTTAIVSTTGVTATITSNANNGWTAYLKSANASLDSAVTGDTIATTGSINGTPSSLTTGAEHYLLDVDETADANTNGSIAGEYNGNYTNATTATGGTFNDTALEAIASGTGVTSNYVMTLLGRATIASTTEAANDYTDTWTVVASGNF